MTVLARGTRRWTGGRKPVLATLLAVATLVPLGVLFLDHMQDQGEGRSVATEERRGIEYLLALSQVTIALTDAQSAAVSGEPVSREALTRALAATAEVDDRVGDELRVRERWSQLRETIEQISAAEYPDGRAAYTSYGEATDLLLDLHDKLRETTGLVRDADADTYYLQDAAGEELPEAIVGAGRLVDLVTIASAESGSEQAAEISVALAGVTSPADDLAAGIQAALDSTESRTLSSNVLSKFDRFLRDKDDLLAAVPPDGDVENVDPGQLASIRIELQAAASDLVTALLVEMDALVETRADELARGQLTAVGAMVAGLLLALGLVALSLSGVRGSGRSRGTPENTRAAAAAPESAGGYQPGFGAPPAVDPLPGELVGSERADVR